ERIEQGMRANRLLQGVEDSIVLSGYLHLRLLRGGMEYNQRYALSLSFVKIFNLGSRFDAGKNGHVVVDQYTVVFPAFHQEVQRFHSIGGGIDRNILIL